MRATLGQTECPQDSWCPSANTGTGWQEVLQVRSCSHCDLSSMQRSRAQTCHILLTAEEGLQLDLSFLNL